MKTFTTQEQDQLIEYATMVAKYAHMLAFQSTRLKNDAEMHQCRMNLSYFTNEMMKITESQSTTNVKKPVQNTRILTEAQWRKEYPNVPPPPANVMINEATQIPKKINK